LLITTVSNPQISAVVNHTSLFTTFHAILYWVFEVVH